MTQPPPRRRQLGSGYDRQEPPAPVVHTPRAEAIWFGEAVGQPEAAAGPVREAGGRRPLALPRTPEPPARSVTRTSQPAHPTPNPNCECRE
ncbi:hypothetical protein [Kitasatospora sp. HPMI-4]|uniref:hypothetical protein n=1 Tax=Kitasatospora sp. HPMI-4 TaxID=3448443 RepID=UPI003F1B49BD